MLYKTSRHRSALATITQTFVCFASLARFISHSSAMGTPKAYVVYDLFKCKQHSLEITETKNNLLDFCIMSSRGLRTVTLARAVFVPPLHPATLLLRNKFPLVQKIPFSNFTLRKMKKKNAVPKERSVPRGFHMNCHA